MRKDQFGIKLSFYAVLAFVLAIFNQTLLCGLLLGFVIWVQRDMWLTRQVMQALFLCLLGSLMTVLSGLSAIIQLIPLMGFVAVGMLSLAGGILALVVLIGAVLALLRVSQGQEAELPIAAALARRAFE